MKQTDNTSETQGKMQVAFHVHVLRYIYMHTHKARHSGVFNWALNQCNATEYR